MEATQEDRRRGERHPARVPVRVTAEGQQWDGTCINYSTEGALVRLDGPWAGAVEVDFELDPLLARAVQASRARVVRASSPDNVGTFLALQFLDAPGLGGSSGLTRT